MGAPADAIFVDGEVHVRPGEDRTEEALAVRDGTVCRIADTYEVEFLEGIETRRVDLDGRTVVPGFVDGYARLCNVGHHLRGTEVDGAGGTPESTEQARENLTAAFDCALERGITTVHDEVRCPETARAYHELALAEDLPIRARLNYHGERGPSTGPVPIEAAERLGLVSGVGTEPLRLETVGIEVSERSAVAVGDVVGRATEIGLRVSATASDEPELDVLLSGFEAAAGTRPRVWLAGDPTEDQIESLADVGATVIGRPARATESSDQLGAANGETHHRGPAFGRLLAAGLPVAFGSNDDLPNPLRDVERATNADPAARLGVTEAIRTATGTGGMNPAPDSGIGTLDVGTPADFVVLSASPWRTPIGQLDVELTVVDGAIESTSH